MAATVGHVLTATTPDNTSYEIRPSHWNSAHAVTLSQNWQATGNTTQSTSGGGDDMYVSGAGLASIGVSSNSIIISVPAGAPSPVNFSAGTTSGNLGSVVFSNSNGVSFGLNGSTVTASHNGLTSQSNQNVTAGNGGFAFQTLSFSNVNGVSFGTSAGSAITASYTVPTQISVGDSNLGNTAGDTGVFTGRVVFVGSNNITLSGSSNGGSQTISIIGAAGGGGAVVSNAIQSVGSATGSGTNTSRFAADDHVHAGVFSMGVTNAGNTIGDTRVDVGRFVLQGGNNVTLSQITAANALNTIIISGGTAAPAPVNFSAGTTSNNLGSVVFSNSNGVSFGLNASTITASHNGVTDRSVSYILLGNTIAAADTTHNLSVLRASFSGPISGGFVGNSLQISVNASHSHGVTGNTTIATVLNDTRIFYSYVGRITGGFNGSSLQMSVDASQSMAALGNIIGGANTTFNDTRISYSYTGNLSGGWQGSNLQMSVPVDASVTLNGNTTHSSTGTYAYRDLRVSGAGIASVGISGGTIIVSVPAGAPSPVNFSAGTTSNNLGSVVFSNSNGVSFGLNGSTITASVVAGGAVVSNAIQIVGSATGSGTNTSRFAADDHVHAGVFSVGVSTGGNTGGDTRVDVGRFVFAGGNNVTLSQATGANGLNTISIHGGAGGAGETRASVYAVSNTTQGTSDTIPLSLLSFHGAGIASVGVSNGSVVISVPSGGGGITNINVSAGTTSQNLSNIVFSNSNGMSFGLNGSTITANQEPISVFDKFQHMSFALRDIQPLGGSWSFNNFELQRPLAMDRFGQHGFFSNASNSTGTYSLSLWFGIYTKNASTLSLWQSSSTEWQFTGSGIIGNFASQHGLRLFTIPMTTTIPAGNYWMGIGARFSTAGANASMSFLIGADVANSTNSGIFGAASNNTWQWQLGRGIWTASSTLPPDSVAFSALSGVINVNKQALLWHLRSDTV